MVSRSQSSSGPRRSIVFMNVVDIWLWMVEFLLAFVVAVMCSLIVVFQNVPESIENHVLIAVLPEVTSFQCWFSSFHSEISPDSLYLLMILWPGHADIPKFLPTARWKTHCPHADYLSTLFPTKWWTSTHLCLWRTRTIEDASQYLLLPPVYLWNYPVWWGFF